MRRHCPTNSFFAASAAASRGSPSRRRRDGGALRSQSAAAPSPHCPSEGFCPLITAACPKWVVPMTALSMSVLESSLSVGHGGLSQQMRACSSAAAAASPSSSSPPPSPKGASTSRRSSSKRRASSSSPPPREGKRGGKGGNSSSNGSHRSEGNNEHRKEEAKRSNDEKAKPSTMGAASLLSTSDPISANANGGGNRQSSTPTATNTPRSESEGRGRKGSASTSASKDSRRDSVDKSSSKGRSSSSAKEGRPRKGDEGRRREKNDNKAHLQRLKEERDRAKARERALRAGSGSRREKLTRDLTFEASAPQWESVSFDDTDSLPLPSDGSSEATPDVAKETGAEAAPAEGTLSTTTAVPTTQQPAAAAPTGDTPPSAQQQSRFRRVSRGTSEAEKAEAGKASIDPPRFSTFGGFKDADGAKRASAAAEEGVRTDGRQVVRTRFGEAPAYTSPQARAQHLSVVRLTGTKDASASDTTDSVSSGKEAVAAAAADAASPVEAARPAETEATVAAPPQQVASAEQQQKSPPTAAAASHRPQPAPRGHGLPSAHAQPSPSSPSATLSAVTATRLSFGASAAHTSQLPQLITFCATMRAQYKNSRKQDVLEHCLHQLGGYFAHTVAPQLVLKGLAEAPRPHSPSSSPTSASSPGASSAAESGLDECGEDGHVLGGTGNEGAAAERADLARRVAERAAAAVIPIVYDGAWRPGESGRQVSPSLLTSSSSSSSSTSNNSNSNSAVAVVRPSHLATWLPMGALSRGYQRASSPSLSHHHSTVASSLGGANVSHLVAAEDAATAAAAAEGGADGSCEEAAANGQQSSSADDAFGAASSDMQSEAFMARSPLPVEAAEAIEAALKPLGPSGAARLLNHIVYFYNCWVDAEAIAAAKTLHGITSQNALPPSATVSHAVRANAATSKELPTASAAVASAAPTHDNASAAAAAAMLSVEPADWGEYTSTSDLYRILLASSSADLPLHSSSSAVGGGQSKRQQLHQQCPPLVLGCLKQIYRSSLLYKAKAKEEPKGSSSSPSPHTLAPAPEPQAPPQTTVDGAATRVRFHSAAMALLWINLLAKYLALHGQSLDLVSTSLALLSLSGGSLRVPFMESQYLPRLVAPLAAANGTASKEWRHSGRIATPRDAAAAGNDGRDEGADADGGAAPSSSASSSSSAIVPSSTTPKANAASRVELVAIAASAAKIIAAYPSLLPTNSQQQQLSNGNSSSAEGARQQRRRFAGAIDGSGSSSSKGHSGGGGGALPPSYNLQRPPHERLPYSLAHRYNNWAPMQHVAVYVKHALVPHIGSFRGNPTEALPIFQLLHTYDALGSLLRREGVARSVADMLASTGSRTARPVASAAFKAQMAGILGETLRHRWAAAIAGGGGAAVAPSAAAKERPRDDDDDIDGITSSSGSAADSGILTVDEILSDSGAAGSPHVTGGNNGSSSTNSNGDGGVGLQQDLALTFSPFLWVAAVESAKAAYAASSAVARIRVLTEGVGVVGKNTNNANSGLLSGEGIAGKANAPPLAARAAHVRSAIDVLVGATAAAPIAPPLPPPPPPSPKTAAPANSNHQSGAQHDGGVVHTHILLLRDGVTAEGLVGHCARRLSCIALFGGYLLSPATIGRIGVEAFSGHTNTVQQWTVGLWEDLAAVSALLERSISALAEEGDAKEGALARSQKQSSADAEEELAIDDEDAAHASSSSSASSSPLAALRAQLRRLRALEAELLALSSLRTDDCFDWSAPASARPSATPSFSTSPNLRPLLAVGTRYAASLAAHAAAAEARARPPALPRISSEAPAALEPTTATAVPAEEGAAVSSPAAEVASTSPLTETVVTSASAAVAASPTSKQSTAAAAPSVAKPKRSVESLACQVYEGVTHAPLGAVVRYFDAAAGISSSPVDPPPPRPLTRERQTELSNLVSRSLAAVRRKAVRAAIALEESIAAASKSPTTVGAAGEGDASTAPVAAAAAPSADPTAESPLTAEGLRTSLATLHLLSLCSAAGFASVTNKWSSTMPKNPTSAASQPEAAKAPSSSSAADASAGDSDVAMSTGDWERRSLSAAVRHFNALKPLPLEGILSAFVLKLVSPEEASVMVRARFAELQQQQQQSSACSKDSAASPAANGSDSSCSAFFDTIHRMIATDVLPVDTPDAVHGTAAPTVLLNLNAMLDAIGRAAFDLRGEEEAAEGKMLAPTPVAEVGAESPPQNADGGAVETEVTAETSPTTESAEPTDADAVAAAQPPITGYRILAALGVEITLIKARYAMLTRAEERDQKHINTKAAASLEKDGAKGGEKRTTAQSTSHVHSTALADRLRFAVFHDAKYSIGTVLATAKVDRQFVGAGSYVVAHLCATYAHAGHHAAREAWTEEFLTSRYAHKPCTRDEATGDTSADASADGGVADAPPAPTRADAIGSDRRLREEARVALEAMLLECPCPERYGVSTESDAPSTSNTMLYPLEVVEDLADAIAAADRSAYTSNLAHRAAVCAASLQAGYDRLLLWVASSASLLGTRWAVAPTQTLRFVARNAAGAGGSSSSSGGKAADDSHLPRPVSPFESASADGIVAALTAASPSSPLNISYSTANGGGAAEEVEGGGGGSVVEYPSHDFANIDTLLKLTTDTFLTRSSCNVGIFKRVTHALSLLSRHGAPVDAGMSLVVAANRLYADRKIREVPRGAYDFAIACTLHPSTHFGIVMVVGAFGGDSSEALTDAMLTRVFRAITVAAVNDLVTSQQRSRVVELAKGALPSQCLDLQCAALRAMAAAHCAPSTIFYQLAAVVLGRRSELTMAQLGDLMACAPHVEACDDVLCPALRGELLDRVRGGRMAWAELRALLNCLSVGYIGDKELWGVVVDRYKAEVADDDEDDDEDDEHEDAGEDKEDDDADEDEEGGGGRAVRITLATVPVELKAALCESACADLLPSH